MEEGSDLAAELWSSPYAAASSLLAYPEGRAALAAARRGGRLGRQGYERAVAEFESLLPELVTVGVDEQLVRVAGDHAADLGLRGYDAVHLATALSLSEEEVAVVTWDEDLGRAAGSVGLAVAGS